LKLDGEGLAISGLALRIVKDQWQGRYNPAPYFSLFEILSALKPLK
jgi:hypothetical protein